MAAWQEWNDTAQTWLKQLEAFDEEELNHFERNLLKQLRKMIVVEPDPELIKRYQKAGVDYFYANLDENDYDIDDEPVVSAGPDAEWDGAYVQMWEWIRATCPKCGDDSFTWLPNHNDRKYCSNGCDPQPPQQPEDDDGWDDEPENEQPASG
jgi:hypothetical protein